jgi:hypothetical protein
MFPYHEPRHLKKVCMTYIEHACFSLKISGCFFVGGICAYVHAFFPNLFPKTSSKISKYIRNEIRQTGCKKGESDEQSIYSHDTKTE